MKPDPKLVHFLVLFNVDRDYYECHDVMEELWLEEGRRPFWQGLLQAAVGLHHWQNDNFSGAIKLFRGAEEKLAPYGEREAGLDLAKLKADIRTAIGRLSGDTEAARPPFECFDIVITDASLAAEAAALAAVPYAERLGDAPDES